MFKSFKARVRSGTDQLRSGSVYGFDKLGKGGKKSPKNKSEQKQQQRSVSAPTTAQPGAQASFSGHGSPKRMQRPPPAGQPHVLPSPVFSSKSFPTVVRYDTVEDERKTEGRYYVYDNAAYSPNDVEFDIFSKSDGITPSSSRLVVQCLTSCFKGAIAHVGDSKVLQQVVKPNLHHFSKEEIQEVKRLIQTLFPHDGCSLKDKELKDAVRRGFGDNVVRLTVALRIIWSSFPKGIIPWDSYYKFIKWESQTGFPPESFHFRFSKFLPDRDYTFCTFAFLEFLLCILLQKNKLMLDKSIQMDMIFTAGATCFVREASYCSPANEETPPVIRSYVQRGNALHRLFVGYIRSLNHEHKMTDVYLLDIFQVETYPPKPYKARSAKALTLTIPKGSSQGNDFTSLIYQAASARKRFYSATTSFSRVENAFLDQFEEHTLRVIMTFFSESSNRYITTFDDGFDADVLHGAHKRHKGQNLSASDDQYAVATWLQLAKEQNGFDELLELLESNHVPEGGTLALGAPTATMGPSTRKRREENSTSVRVGKTDITEWIINSWKYEMFMSRVQNTLLVKLTKKVDECNWLVITCEENVNMSPKAAPPPAKTPPVPKERPQRLQQPKEVIRESTATSLPSNDSLIVKVNNVDLPSSASDTSNEKDVSKTTRGSTVNALGDLLESCYSGNEIETVT
ncbi:(ZYRO0D08954g) [Zygosaccharomyces parabailii]|uniref:ZYBA0S11-00166g1_1 n=1 Tax=Zygosaccharomyces bailii (strain CLIB 213 / ATCC 58445 / CBS 680 / BCRC 21525 / NBRC 1098 / NCYC 1416 / NRRL Y-2227) TaxID=1333698 RepID=A0A8J2TA10_ZYGB2|nr:(ZYRO0D08954g) [Zygosaccharomyces parabailii]CDF91320.1 ZYBA0S11-00166g1_1 [Zygosaccharomyces bailii CLIB 213]